MIICVTSFEIEIEIEIIENYNLSMSDAQCLIM